MVNKKNVFFIPKPTRVNQVVEDRTLLQKIYDKT